MRKVLILLLPLLMACDPQTVAPASPAPTPSGPTASQTSKDTDIPATIEALNPDYAWGADEQGDLISSPGITASEWTVAVLYNFAASWNTIQDARFVELGGNNGPGGGFSIELDKTSGAPTSIHCRLWDDTNHTLEVNGSLPDDTANHVLVCRYDGVRASIWVDGVEQDSAVMPYYTTTGALGIGRATYATTNDFPSTILGVGLWNSYLSSEQIAQITP